MNEHHHDQAIEQAVESLAIIDPASLLTALPQSDASDLERSYAEVLGLLAFVDAPQMPNASIKTALLEQVAHHPRPASAPRSVPDPTPIDPRPETGQDAASGTIGPRTRPWNPWLLAMAALLGMCLIGLAFMAGRVREQRQQIGALQQSVRLSSELAAEQNQLAVEQLRRSEQHLEMITQVARQAYPMRTVGGRSQLASLDREPRGVVWVCGRHQRWYLNVQGLEPAPAGSVYTLWFVTDDGPVKGGVIEVSGQRPGELAAPFMPDGTRSFQVTLETDLNGIAPDGKPVMVADHSIEI